MRPGRILAGLVLALVLALAAPSAVNALWSSRATATASVGAGRLQFAQTGFDGISAVFGSTEDARVAVAPVTVSNTGTVPASYVLQPGAESANNEARAIKVSVWPVQATADCTTSTPVPAEVTTIDWPVQPAVTGSLAPSASVVYCIRSAISAEDASALSGGTMVATLRLTAAVGSWVSETTARATQSVSASGGVATPMPAPVDPVASEPTPAPAGTRMTIAIAGTTWCASENVTTDTAPTVYAQTCDTSTRRTWLISPDVDGYRTIDSTTVASTTWTADGDRIRLTAASGAPAQQWALTANADGSTRITSRVDGRCLTVTPMPFLQGPRQPFSLARCDGSAAQSFTLAGAA